MRTAPIVLALALAGCATATDLATSEIDETQTSSKPVAEVSNCLALRLLVSPIDNADGSQTFIIKNGYQAPIGLLTLRATPTGSAVDLRRPNSMVGGGGWQKCL